MWSKPYCLAPISLIFLIIRARMYMWMLFFHVKHHLDLIELWKLFQTLFFTELWVKQIFHFSLKILTLLYGIHLKIFRLWSIRYSIFALFISLIHSSEHVVLLVQLKKRLNRQISLKYLKNWEKLIFVVLASTILISSQNFQSWWPLLKVLWIKM